MMTRLNCLYIHIQVDAHDHVQALPEDYRLPKDICAAIGSFDGVHKGHQKVIGAAVHTAKKFGRPSAVICFDPHPQTLFNPDAPPFRLMSLTQQYSLFKQLGIDHIIVLRFNQAMAGLSAEDFAKSLLKQTLNIGYISCGYDFNFGRRGMGKADDLQQFGLKLGFEVKIIPCQNDEAGIKLSSSSVREALIGGDAGRAASILGRPQSYRGAVIKGDQKGRTIGFATLNMELGPYQRPKYGVYVSRTLLADGRLFKSVSNFGKRPTVDGLLERFETHLFDFNEDLYGQTVEVSLLDFIRPEQKFDSLEHLKEQIIRDSKVARAYSQA